jgi:hypothetical protein
MKKTAFITEMGFQGEVTVNHPNMRTEFAWMCSMNADHFSLADYKGILNYDNVFVIFPKGDLFLNAIGSKISDGKNKSSTILKSDFIDVLKTNNKKINLIQEGPHWLYNDYEIEDQILYYNMVCKCDVIYAHNECDVKYYKGVFPNKVVKKIKTLMIDALIKNILPSKEDKTIIGGNFSRWYGGFESYLVAREFLNPIWTQTSHAKRENEEQVENLNHLPRLIWLDWMKNLSTFKYAVHLMPTVAAGTFSLNCAYFGIPCIGNKNVDTQRICHPDLSVDVYDVEKARSLAIKLKSDNHFYDECSKACVDNYTENYSQKIFSVDCDI